MTKAVRGCVVAGAAAAVAMAAMIGCQGESIAPDAGCVLQPPIQPSYPQQSLQDIARALGAGGTGQFVLPNFFPTGVADQFSLTYQTLPPISCSGDGGANPNELRVAVYFTWNAPPDYIAANGPPSPDQPPPPISPDTNIVQAAARFLVDSAGNTQVYVNAALYQTIGYNFMTEGLMEYSPPAGGLGGVGRLSNLTFPVSPDYNGVYGADYTLNPPGTQGGAIIKWFVGCDDYQTTVTLTSTGGTAPTQCTPDGGPPFPVPTYDGGTDASYQPPSSDDASDDTKPDPFFSDGGGGSSDATLGGDGTLGPNSAPFAFGAPAQSPAQEETGGGCTMGRTESSSVLGPAGLVALGLVVRRRRRRSTARLDACEGGQS